MLPSWVATYVGIPFLERGRDRRGCDCWGLCRLVWREQFGLEVPSYVEGYRSTTDAAEISALIHGSRGLWRQVELEEARPGDGLLIRMQGVPMHVGVVVEPPAFLHVERGINGCVDRFDSPRWARRVLGAFRHEAMTPCLSS
jgi:cell wall-associated NlpC family hydrolase